MRIRISDPSLVSDLLEFLRRSEWTAVRTSRDILAVSISRPLRYDAARMELNLHLAEWQASHSGVHTVVID